ncbi:hypothetical protein KI387_030198, partial [Taxus chinensis]
DSSSTVFSFKQTNFFASLAVDVHFEHNDVLMELLHSLLNNENGNNNSNIFCDGEHTVV